jgi:hypothetical protein
MFLEIIDRIVVLQELGSKNPVFFFLTLSSHSSEFPWAYQKEASFLSVFLFMHHVALLWHVYYFRFSGFISNHIESQVWKTVEGLLIAHAAPDWLGFKTLNSGLLLDGNDHISEGLFWSHGETHTVIKDKLLWFLREGLSTELDFVTIYSPIASVSRLFHPENVFLL